MPASAPRCRRRGSAGSPCRCGPRAPSRGRRTARGRAPRRGRGCTGSRRPGRRTPRASTGRGTRARPCAGRPSPRRCCPPTRSAWGASSFTTNAWIDSRRRSCSSVKMKCGRLAPWSGLRTGSAALMVGDASGLVRCAVGAWRRRGGGAGGVLRCVTLTPRRHCAGRSPSARRGGCAHRPAGSTALLRAAAPRAWARVVAIVRGSRRPLHRVHLGVYAVGHPVLGSDAGSRPSSGAGPRCRWPPLGGRRAGLHPALRASTAVPVLADAAAGIPSRHLAHAPRPLRRAIPSPRRPHDPRPRRHRLRPPAQARPRPGGDPGADRLPRPRCPGPSPPAPPRSDAAPEAPRRPTRPAPPAPDRPRDRVPRPLRAPRPPAPARQRGARDRRSPSTSCSPTTASPSRPTAGSWHRGRAAFERDRERDAILATKGYRTLRFTDRQIENDPAHGGAGAHRAAPDR